MIHPLLLRGSSINRPRDILDVGGIRYRRYFAHERANRHQCKYLVDGSVMRFEVRSGDYGDASNAATGNERSELAAADVLTPGHGGSIFQFEEDGWLGFSFRIDTPITADFAICGQWHDYPEPDDVHMSPPLSFVAYPSSLRPDGTTRIPFALATMYDPNRSSTVNNPNYRTRWSGDLTMGVYRHIVLHFRASIVGTGLLEMWMDGQKVLDLSGISFGFNNLTGFAYWQWGIYRKADPKTMIARYANMELKRTSLMHRVANPLPIMEW